MVALDESCDVQAKAGLFARSVLVREEPLRKVDAATRHPCVLMHKGVNGRLL